MKTLFQIFAVLIILFQIQKVHCQTSTDSYAEGMEECLGEENFKIISALFEEINDKILEAAKESENPYFDFSTQFCEGKIEADFFVVTRESKLDSLIKKALASKFWYVDQTDADTPIIVDGKEVEITPVGSESKKSKSKDLENIYLNGAEKLIACLKALTSQESVANYYGLYDRLGIANSSVKICGMYDLIPEEDFKSSSVQYFIGLDAILQKILHQNDYEQFVRE